MAQGVKRVRNLVFMASCILKQHTAKAEDSGTGTHALRHIQDYRTLTCF